MIIEGFELFCFAGTTEGAIEKRNVDLRDLPPPLFCRPRKSPKYISDSKQPSISCITNFGASDNRSMMCESRRQSNTAQRLDFDGTHSLHGSLTGHLRDSSPFITRHRRLDHTPLYINNNESEMNDFGEEFRKEGINGNVEEQEQSKKQVAMVGPMVVRPMNVLNSINSSSEEEIGEKKNSKFCDEHEIHDEIFLETLRSGELTDEYSKFKSYSLDPFPSCQVKKRVTEHYRKRMEDVNEPVKVDCNGGVSISQSQRSDHIPLLVNTNRKRWHSLEMVRANADQEISGCEDLNDNSKKSLGRNIIKSWLVGIFQSNGLKGSTRNGSGILLQQQPPAVATKPDKETSIV